MENVTSNSSANYNGSGGDLLPDHPTLVISNNIWMYCSPFLIFTGTFGNLMTIAVLLRKSMWKMSSSPYLVVLGVADMCVLYTALFRQWLRYLVDFDIRGLSVGMCKLHVFLVYTTLDFSVWILVGVSVERFIFVCFPFKAKAICTRRRSYIFICLMLLLWCALNSHLLYGYGIVQDAESKIWSTQCTSLYKDYDHFVFVIWPWIDLSVFSLIPFCIILICNISLIFKIHQSRSRNRVVPLGETRSDQRVKPSSMTALMVSLNTLFIITTGPVSVYLICYEYWAQDATYEESLQLTLWWAIVNMLMYSNNSVNFIFYCITGNRFRRELRAMCGIPRSVAESEIRISHLMTSRHTGSTVPPRQTASRPSVSRLTK